MSMQIALRLPDDVVEFIDGEVTAGRARSRADLVARYVDRDRRRRRAEHDAELLLAARPESETDDFSSLAELAARFPLDVD